MPHKLRRIEFDNIGGHVMKHGALPNKFAVAKDGSAPGSSLIFTSYGRCAGGLATAGSAKHVCWAEPRYKNEA
ncbi:hypothetical protein GCM10025771_30840 [Niveibacterium umoris]